MHGQIMFDPEDSLRTSLKLLVLPFFVETENRLRSTVSAQ